MIPYYLIALAATGVSALGLAPHARHRAPERLRALRRSFAAGWTPIDVVVVTGLIVFSAIRYGIGSDYGLYTNLYRVLNPGDWGASIDRSPQEIGFTLVSLSLRLLGPDPRPLFVLSSASTVLLCYAALKRDSALLPLSIAMYCLLGAYLQPFNTVRQGLAIALLFFANRFLPRRWYLWVLLVALAGSLHSTALFAGLLQLLILRWRPTPTTSALVVLGVGIVGGLLLHLPVVVDQIGAINPRYAAYLLEGGSGIGTYLVALVWAALLVTAYVVDRQRACPRWLAYCTLAALFTVVGTFSPDAGRMADYFSPYFALLLPAVLAGSRHRRPLVAILLAGSLAYFTVYLLSFNGLLPYAASIG